jgi:hypothetical protein
MVKLTELDDTRDVERAGSSLGRPLNGRGAVSSGDGPPPFVLLVCPFLTRKRP